LKVEKIQIKELDISAKYKYKEIVKGSLDLSGFINLEELICTKNQITNLKLSCCPNLKRLNCSCNLLTNLDLSKNPRLEYLFINDNSFAEQNLSFLSHLVNLKSLNLSGNYFFGSLEPLKN